METVLLNLFTKSMIISALCLAIGLILAICAFFSPICYWIAAGFIIAGLVICLIGSIILTITSIRRVWNK